MAKSFGQIWARAGVLGVLINLSACGNLLDQGAPTVSPVLLPPVAAARPTTAPEPGSPAPARVVAAAPVAPSSTTVPPTLSGASNEFIAPDPIPFERSIARAGEQLMAAARSRLGNEARTLVIDPLIDANTGSQTVSTAQMGRQLESIVKTRHAPQWSLRQLTRQSLAEKPLLLIGTLTPVNVERAVDTKPDAFRVWLTLIDLRTGRVVAKQIDRATVDSVNPEPLKYFSDSPTWHKDKTVQGYINSCQINTKIGDPADPDYLSRLPAAAVVNEAIMAYSEGRIPVAQRLYKEAEPLADAGDLRVLNGLYLTSWQLGQRDTARDAFNKLVASGLEAKRLPLKMLFQPGRTTFNQLGDLPQQYNLWVNSLAQGATKAQSCVRIVGHTSRTGSAGANLVLSRQRAEAVQRLLERDSRGLTSRLRVEGVGSREALVGLGTDDQRDALDRRVEFRVVDCV